MGKTTISVAPDVLAQLLLPGALAKLVRVKISDNLLHLEIESSLLVDAPRTDIAYGRTVDGKTYIAQITPVFGQPEAAAAKDNAHD